MSELQRFYKALDALAGNERIQKSAYDKELSPREARAVRIAKATKTPAGAALARRIMELEKAEAIGLGYGLPLAQAMGISKERFTAQNGPVEMRTDDELLAALEEISRELKRRGYTEEEAEDDWSSAFEEA